MINKIFRQRLDDPEPLENIARGVPAAFAAMVRKLMAKKPDERYQTCKELRATWRVGPTPPGCAILGAEAEAARSFHPPPPLLADEDLRCYRSPTIRAPTYCRCATWEMPSPRRLLVIAGRCLRFPPRSGTGPSPTPAPHALATTPAGYSIFP